MFNRVNLSCGCNPEVDLIRAGGLTWMVRSPFLSPELRRLLESPDRHLPHVDSMTLHDRPSTSIQRGASFFLKRFNRPGTLKMFKSVFRKSPAKTAFCAALQLERAGIATARAITLADLRFGRLLLRCYLVTETIQNARNLDEWAEPERLRALETANLVANLHRNGFLHRDLNLRNILVDERGELFIVDLDRVRHQGILTKREAIDDLARFSRNSLRFTRLARKSNTSSNQW